MFNIIPYIRNHLTILASLAIQIEQRRTSAKLREVDHTIIDRLDVDSNYWLHAGDCKA